MKLPFLLCLTFALTLPAFAEGPTNSASTAQKVEASADQAVTEVKAEPAKIDQTVKHEKTDAEKAACKESSKVKCDANKAWESTKEAGRGVGEVAKEAAGVALQGTAKVADQVTSGLEKAAETLKHTAKKLEGEEKSQ